MPRVPTDPSSSTGRSSPDRIPRGPSDADDPVARPAAVWRRWWDAQADTDTPAVQLAARQGFVLTTAQLGSVGVSRQQARTRVRRGTWSAPALRGVVAPVNVLDDGPNSFLAVRRLHALNATAAVLRRPDHVVTSRSAAILRGLPTVSVPQWAEITARDPQTSGRRPGAHVFAAGLRPADVTDWFGSPVTTVARTLVDLARHDRKDAIMAADAALRESLTTRRHIERSLADAWGWPGVRQARRVLALADPRAESPLESLTRLALAEDEFPAAEPQVVIDDAERRTHYRVDLLLVAQRLVLECDGRVKYESDPQQETWWAEKRRETRLRALGYRVERLTWDDVMSYWPQTSRRLRRLLREPSRFPARVVEF